MNVYEIRDAGFVHLGWSENESRAWEIAAEIEAERDRETTVREVEYDADLHTAGERIPDALTQS